MSLKKFTVQQWLESIFDEEVKKKAIDNTIKQNGFCFLETFPHATELKCVVPRCFKFSETPEGQDYWIEKVKEM